MLHSCTHSFSASGNCAQNKHVKIPKQTQHNLAFTFFFPALWRNNAEWRRLIAGPCSDVAVSRLVWLEQINHPPFSPPLQSAAQKSWRQLVSPLYFFSRIWSKLWLQSFLQPPHPHTCSAPTPHLIKLQMSQMITRLFFVFVHLSGCQSTARFKRCRQSNFCGVFSPLLQSDR